MDSSSVIYRMHSIFDFSLIFFQAVCSKPSPLSQKRKNKAKDKLAKKRKKGRPPKVATPVSVVSIDSQISLATLESPVSISTNQEERSTPVEAVKDEEDVDIERQVIMFCLCALSEQT